MARNFQASEHFENITDQRMIAEERVISKLLRERLPTIYDQYKFVTETQNKDLPYWKNSVKRPKWVTEEYLRGVMEDKYFSLTKDQTREPVKVTKEATKGELREYIERLSGKNLGFGIGQEPKKKWLLKILYSIQPNHEVFRPTEDEVKTTIPAG